MLSSLFVPTCSVAKRGEGRGQAFWTDQSVQLRLDTNHLVANRITFTAFLAATNAVSWVSWLYVPFDPVCQR